jgi:drug/metabolite transporter (DMT)-like permease
MAPILSKGRRGKWRMQAVSSTMGGREWAMLLALAVLWGGSFFFNGVAVRELPAFTLVWLRVAIAAITLLLLLRSLGIGMPRERRVWMAFFGMGLLNNVVPFFLIVWGQHRIPSGLASILNATTPLFTVVVAHWLTADEKLSGMKVVGVAVGFLGAATTIGFDVFGGLGSDLFAELACLGAALSYAFAGIFGRRFRRMGVQPLMTAAGQVCASTVLLLPAVLIIDRPWTIAPPSVQTWGAVLGVALLSTALGYVLYFRVLAAAGATNLLLVTFLLPVSAILLGVLVLGEVLQVRQIVGMGVIGFGLVFVDGRLPRLLFRRRRAIGGTA